MLTISDTRMAHNCAGFSRRDFLRVGSLGLGGLTLSQLLGARAGAGVASGLKPYVKDKSIVLLFLHGGPPQHETWDPKPDAPGSVRSMFGTVGTSLPGVHFGSHFPKMAKLAHRLAIVRSFQSRSAEHTYHAVSTAGNRTKAAMGALYARLAGANHPATGMPTNVLVLPEAVQPDIALGSNFETSALPTLTQPGSLGPNYEAFNVAGFVSHGGSGNGKQGTPGRGNGDNTIRSEMQMRIDPDRFTDRRHLLDQLDKLKREADGPGVYDVMDHYQQQAFDVITKGVGNAFDLSREDPRTLAQYDSSKLFRLEDVTRWGDMKRASNMLGHQMLMARRLCEAGCGFVTVSDCGWDMHSNGNSPKNLGGMHWLGSQVDHVVAAFLEDVQARGLSDKILLVITGEMGRTPHINGDGGRDHHADLTPLVLAGGGLKMGQVIGQSDRLGARPATEPYGPENLMATIFQTVFDLGQMRIDLNAPREAEGVAQGGKPIQELF